MKPCTHEETMRIAQFAFVTRYDGHKCPGCGNQMIHCENWTAMADAIDMVQTLVGLPAPEDPDFTDEVLEERQRRRKGPPVATVRVRPDMSAQAIYDAIKAQLQT